MIPDKSWPSHLTAHHLRHLSPLHSKIPRVATNPLVTGHSPTFKCRASLISSSIHISAVAENHIQHHSSNSSKSVGSIKLGLVLLQCKLQVGVQSYSVNLTEYRMSSDCMETGSGNAFRHLPAEGLLSGIKRRISFSPILFSQIFLKII